MNRQNSKYFREGEGGTEKWCSSCSDWKSIVEFGTRLVRGHTRSRSKCRACEAARWRTYADRKRTEKLAAQAATGMKPCGTCDLELPLKDFNKSSAAFDGLQSECRECHAIRERNAYIDKQTTVCGPVWDEGEADWKQLAACKDQPAEWWLDNPYSRNAILTANAVRAKRVCAECPVIEQCRALNDAIEIGTARNTYVGIWAGETIPERMERRRLESDRQAA